jgi:DNA-binding NarL/FixJ family response regulator
VARIHGADSSAYSSGFLLHATLISSMHTLSAYLVEDSPVIRQSLISALEELSQVNVVGTSEDEGSAVSWLSDANHKVDLVITDIFLKAGSGLGVLRRIHALALGCKLVVLTNYATADMRQRCLELGADRVFDKSNDIDALVNYCGRLNGGYVDTAPLGLPQ